MLLHQKSTGLSHPSTSAPAPAMCWTPVAMQAPAIAAHPMYAYAFASETHRGPGAIPSLDPCFPELSFPMADVDRHPSEPNDESALQTMLSLRSFKLYLAQNVTSARRRAGLTQLQLAQAAELSRATVHLIEAGICDPRLSTITRLADALNINALELLAKDEKIA